eukprot:9874719-Ditylum_brightwellii.AAC.1
MTTSPSGQHLGHIKALQSRGPDAPTSEDGKAHYKKQQALIKAQVDMVNYAVKYKYSYERWKNIVNIIIQKESGNNKIHKIRFIYICKADYSAMTVIIWRSLIQSSERRKTVHKGQVGGRAGHNANTLHS